ncbi:hypothetical protein [Synechococcus sp. UW105]|uniref:hypothetical protein n=1 Tax=Synechococcus sp. UW105 TaxID=337067 RepID=UPI000E0E1DF1|nr:hypothetical protein [Synechococcus sp. UW105]
MQLIPILLLIASTLYSLASSLFWLLHVHSPVDVGLLQGVFSGLFYLLPQLTLGVVALVVSAIVLIKKQYSNKSLAVGVIVLSAAFCVVAATELASLILYVWEWV